MLQPVKGKRARYLKRKDKVRVNLSVFLSNLWRQRFNKPSFLLFDATEIDFDSDISTFALILGGGGRGTCGGQNAHIILGDISCVWWWKITCIHDLSALEDTNSWLTFADPSTKWWKPGRPPFFGTRHPRCHGVPTEGPKTRRKGGGGFGNSVIDARYWGA